MPNSAPSHAVLMASRLGSPQNLGISRPYAASNRTTPPLRSCHKRTIDFHHQKLDSAQEASVQVSGSFDGTGIAVLSNSLMSKSSPPFANSIPSEIVPSSLVTKTKVVKSRSRSDLYILFRSARGVRG